MKRAIFVTCYSFVCELLSYTYKCSDSVRCSPDSLGLQRGSADPDLGIVVETMKYEFYLILASERWLLALKKQDAKKKKD